MKLAILTRFSFFGKSGWKHDNSRSQQMLFDPKRLEKRFAVFEAITLPSIMAQSDKEFRWYILSSSLMPENYKDRLRGLICASMGDRAIVSFNRPAKAGAHIRDFVYRDYQPDDLIALSVLDDDDGLSSEFVLLCKEAARKTASQFNDELYYSYISFPYGLTLDLFAEKQQLHQQRERWINLGLTSVAKASFRKNPLLTRHKVVHRFHPTRVFYGKRLSYVRTIHTENDSQPSAPASERPIPENVQSQIDKLFPFLTSSALANLRAKIGSI